MEKTQEDYLTPTNLTPTNLFGTQNPYNQVVDSLARKIFSCLDKKSQWTCRLLNKEWYLFSSSHGVDVQNPNPQIARYTAFLSSKMGKAYYDSKHSSKAILYYQQALEIHDKVLAQKIPSDKDLEEVATCLSNLGLAYWQVVDYWRPLEGSEHIEKAIEHLNRALDTRELIYNRNHALIATSLSQLGDVSYGSKSWQAAIYCYQQAVNIREENLGAQETPSREDREELATCLNKLGLAYCQVATAEEPENREAATNYLKRALDIRKGNHQQNHTLTATSLSQLGDVSYGSENWQAAIHFYQQALDIREEIIRHQATPSCEDREEVATCLSKLGLAYCQVATAKKPENREAATNCLKRALDIRKKAYGLNHTLVADSLCSLGKVQLGIAISMTDTKLDREEALAKAISYYEEAYNIEIKIYNQGDEKVVTTCSYLANAYTRLGNRKRAGEYLRKALDWLLPPK